ncbi:MAG: hypothetical protein ABUL44_04690, partial [Flavobacterium sp.]
LKNLLKQIYESDIDLLLVDYLMTDKGMLTFNGDEVAREYEKIKPRFPVLIFTQHHDDAFPEVDNPNIIYEKSEAKKIDHFCEILTKNILVYKKFISERKSSIGRLITKSKKKKLTAKEKHTLLDKQIELQMLDKESIEVPFQLLDSKKIAGLTKTANDAEKFIKSFIKKK